MSKSQLIVDSNNVYIHKEDGSVLPVNHPDISTQPSILPQRFGKLNINEVLVQISSKNELTDKGISNFNNLYAQIKEGEFIYPDSTILDIKLIGNGKFVYPTKAIKENGVWKIYFDMSMFLDLKYAIVKYYYHNYFN